MPEKKRSSDAAEETSSEAADTANMAGADVAPAAQDTPQGGATASQAVTMTRVELENLRNRLRQKYH